MREYKAAVLGLLSIVVGLGADPAQGRDRKESMAIQEALVWSGHYEGTIDGLIQSGTRRAIRGFQREIGGRATGRLTPEQIDELATRAARLREKVGYRRYDDAGTGITIGLPLRLTPPRSRTDRGSRFVAEDKSVEIELFRFLPEQGSISELYRRVQNGGPERKVTYKVLGRRWFVVSGTEGSIEFYTRARAEQSGVAAFAIAYESSLSEIVEPIIVAMSSSFAHPEVLSIPILDPPGDAEPVAEAEPEGGPQQAAGEQPESGDTVAALNADRPTQPLGPRNRSPVATAFLVSDKGHALTSARAVRCETITVGTLGEAKFIALDQQNALALLELPGAAGKSAVRFSKTPVQTGDRVTTAGADSASSVNGRIAYSPNAGRLKIALPSREGDGGAPLFDEEGGVVGVLLPVGAEAVGTSRPAQRTALGARAVTAFLSALGVGRGAGSDTKSAALPVYCQESATAQQ